MNIKRLTIVAAALAVALGTQAQGDVDYDCLIEPSVSVELGSAVRGVARVINVKRGDNVDEGEVLVELDSRVQRATVALAKARSENTAELASRKESLELANKRLERFRGLYESKNVSQQQLEEAESQAVIAESEWQQARENKISAELELDEATAVLALRSITSPIRGVVVDRMIAPGELVSEEEPVMKLAALDPLYVEVILPASAFGTISVDAPAIVHPEGPIEGKFRGRVDIVDAVIDAASGTFGVRIELANPDLRLPAGLGCEVDFDADGMPAAG